MKSPLEHPPSLPNDTPKCALLQMRLYRTNKVPFEVLPKQFFWSTPQVFPLFREITGGGSQVIPKWSFWSAAKMIPLRCSPSDSFEALPNGPLWSAPQAIPLKCSPNDFFEVHPKWFLWSIFQVMPLFRGITWEVCKWSHWSAAKVIPLKCSPSNTFKCSSSYPFKVLLKWLLL